jgi:putative ABC transport system permease protein
MTSFLFDLRYAARTLRRSPLFTLVAVLTLAICSGADTAIFSVVDGVLLKPLPYPNASELVAIWQNAPGAQFNGGKLPTSASMFYTYTEQNRVFQHMGVWTPASASITGVGEPEEVPAALVSDGLLPTLGIAPVLGRSFSVGDFELSATPTAILSYGYWQRRFGGERSVIGRTITGNGVTAEIIGVMPRGFRVADTGADLLIPLQFDRSRLTLPAFNYLGIARLKPGVTLAEANADVGRMLPIWLESWPPFPGGDRRFYSDVWKIGPALMPLKQDVIGSIGSVLWVVMGTIAAVLLIACANLTNLLLVRGQGRERERAVRAALGGGAWRIARGLMLESLTLGLAGGALGLAVAFAVLKPLLALAPAGLPRIQEISLDGRAVTFAVGVSLAAGLALGLIPALKYAAPRLATALHGGRAASQGRESRRAQSVLVVLQVALALVLLVSSGLMIRTFQALRSVEPGFEHATELQTFRLSIPDQLVSEPERVMRMEKEILDTLAAIPSVASASFTSSMIMDGVRTAANVVGVEGVTTDPTAPAPLRRFRFVSPGFLATAGTRIVAGRDITWPEVYDAAPVAMISENFARELFGEPSAALGKRITGVDGRWHDIVGVVQDVRDDGLSQPSPVIVYWPPFKGNAGNGFGGAVVRGMTVVLRSPLAGTAALMQQVQRAVWSVNSALPLAAPQTMQEIYAVSLARTTFTLMMLATAGGVALGLAVVGLYGVLSYAASLRRREIAIRVALGAQDRHVRRTFLAYGVGLALVGVALGCLAAAVVSQLMTSLLSDVTPLDPLTYAVAALLLIAVAVVASYVPARRASAVDPAQLLSAE